MDYNDFYSSPSSEDTPYEPDKIFDSNGNDRSADFTEETHKDFYKKLRKKLNAYVQKHPNSKFIQYLVFLPDLFHLLCKLLIDPDVNIADKIVLGSVVAYMVSPLDLIPDAIPGIGMLDDAALAVYAINRILNNAGSDVIARNWAGEGDVFETVKGVLSFAETNIGGSILKKLGNIVNKNK